jgi:NAD+ kinase
VLQLPASAVERGVAPFGDVAGCDLVAAIGGDGTVLTALHAAAPTGTPVLGVACGSLGALTTTTPGDLPEALDRFVEGDWSPLRLTALAVDTPEGHVASAINDLVLVRRAGAQLIVAVWVADDLYTRLAGDGLIVATTLGSSAYSMAAGGPLLVAGTGAFICTPLAMHGGCAPPVVVPSDTEVTLDVEPGHGGFDVEIDGHRVEPTAKRFAVRSRADYAILVRFGEPDTGLAGLRRRGLVTDSPRVLARELRSERPGAPAPAVPAGPRRP